MSCGISRGESRRVFRVPGNLGTSGFNQFELVPLYPSDRMKASDSPHWSPYYRRTF